MIRVLLAEDVQILRRALASLIALEPDIDVVAELADGDHIVSTAERYRPHVAVLDIDLPGTDGITAAEALHTAVPECRALILTSLGRPGNLRRAVAASVSGFLLKDIDPERLVAAIRALARGEHVVDPELAIAALEPKATRLTAREVEVLQLTAEGEGTRQIASRLCLSVGTVRNYLTATVSKLNARNRVDAIRIAQQGGWL
ncbi:response regulator transcription factor [Streptomyces sp. SID11385]|uniref:response regulator n=1 Tax=Streptomyces sp. SID11385 TaxID=2706031 RepID=UPI0013CBD7EE|nr:response regulator transcription factor [Streptomyces sp. SID11385]